MTVLVRFALSIGAAALFGRVRWIAVADRRCTALRRSERSGCERLWNGHRDDKVR